MIFWFGSYLDYSTFFGAGSGGNLVVGKFLPIGGGGRALSCLFYSNFTGTGIVWTGCCGYISYYFWINSFFGSLFSVITSFCTFIGCTTSEFLAWIITSTFSSLWILGGVGAIPLFGSYCAISFAVSTSLIGSVFTSAFFFRYLFFNCSILLFLSSSLFFTYPAFPSLGACICMLCPASSSLFPWDFW